MRQLSSLDAQFLAVEDGRTHGHVSVLGIYDAQSASGSPTCWAALSTAARTPTAWPDSCSRPLAAQAAAKSCAG